jgi:hypothetical protein
VSRVAAHGGDSVGSLLYAEAAPNALSLPLAAIASHMRKEDRAVAVMLRTAFCAGAARAIEEKATPLG